MHATSIFPIKNTARLLIINNAIFTAASRKFYFNLLPVSMVFTTTRSGSEKCERPCCKSWRSWDFVDPD